MEDPFVSFKLAPDKYAGQKRKQYNSTSEDGKSKKIIDEVHSLTSTTFFSFGLIHPFVVNAPSGSAGCYQRYQGTDSTR